MKRTPKLAINDIKLNIKNAYKKHQHQMMVTNLHANNNAMRYLCIGSGTVSDQVQTLLMALLDKLTVDEE